MNFKQHLKESSEGRNIHLEHLEDQVFNKGIIGARDSILFLRSLRDMLAGHTSTGMFVTTKFDGSPAIFAGINPENGKFFVGTKSIFNETAKLNYTAEDIENNHSHAPGLVKKLKIALQYLPELGISDVWQGDIMFTREDLKEEIIDGQRFLIFQPNTIVYAVPIGSQLSHTIQRAQIGIVWHTQYTGEKISEMHATFKPNTNQLNVTPNVWYRDARFVDASGVATFTQEESIHITALLSQAGSLFQKMNGNLLNYIAQNETYKNQIKVYNNSKIRMGVGIGNSSEHVLGLMRWVEEKANKNIIDSKQVPTRIKREKEKTEQLSFYRANFGGLVTIFDMLKYITDAKAFIIRKLQSVKGLGTFLRTEYGFKVTAPEGFVAIDHEGRALKLVDRLEFSKANFNANKNWDEEIVPLHLPLILESRAGGPAREKAEKLGMKYLGFGRYGKKGYAYYKASQDRKNLIKYKNPIEHGGDKDFTDKNEKTKRKIKALKIIKRSDKDTKFSAVLKRSSLAKLEKETLKLDSVLSDEESETIGDYTSSSYASINKFLRGDKKVSKYTGDVDKRIERLDSIFAKHKTTQEYIVYRRSGDSEKFGKMKPDDVYVEKGYTSTSIDPNVANDFSGIGMLVIRIPKGSKALYLGMHSSHDMENEVLLGRGARLKLIRIDERNPKSFWGKKQKDYRYIFDYIGNDK